MTYDPSNVFARILRGELPCAKVMEDDHVLVIMDAMPQAPGHALVIPKTPCRNMLDCPPAVFDGLFRAVQRLAQASKIAFAADGITIMQFNEGAGGQTVFHLHVHVIPRHEGIALARHAGGMERPEILTAGAEKLKTALASLPA